MCYFYITKTNYEVHFLTVTAKGKDQEHAFVPSVQNSVILWNDCPTVESFSQDYGEDTSVLEFVCAQEYHFQVITQAHCVNTHLHPSVCTSHTYLTMFVVTN